MRYQMILNCVWELIAFATGLMVGYQLWHGAVRQHGLPEQKGDGPMHKYLVEVTQTVEVEAKDYDDAVVKAMDAALNGEFYAYVNEQEETPEI